GVKNNVQKDLADRQQKMLELITQIPSVTLQELSEKLNVSVKTIQCDFLSVKKLEINIIRKDGKRLGEWVIQS
ncbi:MAG: DeoR family transcriptional regulator, partial [Bacteroidales bacterium]|nr:DeoR family transcriptional regulator [Bacteroidales bacterium]